MPIANVIRVSILGSLPNGEVWSVNPVWQIGGVSTAEDVTQADVVAMATAIAALVPPAGILGMLGSTTTLSGCRVEARRWDGTLAALAQASKVTPTAGTGSNAHPYQTSIVTSLRTSGVGGSGRGRLYWPGTGQPLNPDLRIPSASTATIAAAAKTYLTSITGAMAPSLTNAPVLSVWSRTNSSTLPVNSIIVGDIADVQRRRRDALVETSSSVTFP